jgi:hypothetical protein
MGRDWPLKPTIRPEFRPAPEARKLPRRIRPPPAPSEASGQARRGVFPGNIIFQRNFRFKQAIGACVLQFLNALRRPD